MPFKIVQTQERGKTFLSCVPEGWESEGTLLWPKKGSKKLLKNEGSLPEEDWISTPCEIKRYVLSYDEGQLELKRMEFQSDTDDERSLSKKKTNYDLINYDLNHLAEQSSLNINNTLATTDAVAAGSSGALPIDDSLDIVRNFEDGQAPIPVEVSNEITSHLPTITPVEAAADSYFYIETTESNVQATVFQRLDNIEQTQKTILLKLAEISTQIDVFLRKSSQEMLNNNVGFKPIDNVESLQNFEDLLSDNGYVDSNIQKLSVVCGSGKGRGMNNCFALVDIMFSRSFLTQCSWAGGSRDSENKKVCFKGYSRVIKLFFSVIHRSDESFTMLECETFFKNILKNSVRRNSAKRLRASTTKSRAKGKKITKTVVTVATHANTEELPSTSKDTDNQNVVS